ncbi:BlaI family transcriptional regulator [uncultured Actinomyces sp.]|uniref:BlaI family transcriptional regulator n=1 Tax=uncultured Actinomyces sp. TaxID=249061 RepID=UPI0028897E15|nr:BlaI family transcriptional regulator [uncultured Actinomyces sp.]
MTPPAAFVDQLADGAVFARELGFIQDVDMLAALAASGVITASEHEAFYTRLAEMCRPVYQWRKLSVLTG